MDKMAWRTMRLGSRMALRTVDVTFEGAAKVPERGPAIIAARHYHHLYDGCALLKALPRQVHVVAGLDWLEPGLAATAMRRACEAARWPVVTRSEKGAAIGRDRFAESRRAYADIFALLRDDRIVLIFPEAYPAIDPHPSPRPEGETMLPFQRGFAQIAIAAMRAGMTVPVVPAGLAYDSDPRWKLTLTFGPPLYASPAVSKECFVRQVEDQVRLLSGVPALPERLQDG